MRRFVVVVVAVLAGACTVNTADTQLPGAGLAKNGGAVSVDPARVPVVASCAAGQVPQRTDTGWECVTPTPPTTAGAGLKASGAQLAVDPASVPLVSVCGAGQIIRRTADGWACAAETTYSAGDGIVIGENTIGAKFGTGTDEVARGAHTHAWEDLDVPSVWPGSVPAERVTGLAAAATTAVAASGVPWTLVGGLTAATEWPGTVPAARVEGLCAGMGTTWR